MFSTGHIPLQNDINRWSEYYLHITEAQKKKCDIYIPIYVYIPSGVEPEPATQRKWKLFQRFLPTELLRSGLGVIRCRDPDLRNVASSRAIGNQGFQKE